jgi:hypothetical protein
MAKKVTPVLEQLYCLVYDNTWKAVKWDRDRSSGAWGRFWSLLIGMGFRFEKTDLTDLGKALDQDKSRWNRRSFHSPDEGHYSQAVIVGNVSFCAAFEEWVGRLPFITKGIDYGYLNRCTEGYIKRVGEKTQGRLVIGAWFTWKGERVKVTSFVTRKVEDQTEHSLIACAYHPAEKIGYEPSKIRKRFTITAEEFKQERKKANQKEVQQ